MASKVPSQTETPWTGSSPDSGIRTRQAPPRPVAPPLPVASSPENHTLAMKNLQARRLAMRTANAQSRQLRAAATPLPRPVMPASAPAPSLPPVQMSGQPLAMQLLQQRRAAAGAPHLHLVQPSFTTAAAEVAQLPAAAPQIAPQLDIDTRVTTDDLTLWQKTREHVEDAAHYVRHAVRGRSYISWQALGTAATVVLPALALYVLSDQVRQPPVAEARIGDVPTALIDAPRMERDDSAVVMDRYAVPDYRDWRVNDGVRSSKSGIDKILGASYGYAIIAAAKEYNLDPRILAGIAVVETGGTGKINLVSGPGAKGLFQIMDNSANGINAFDPVQSAYRAAAMMAEFIPRYGLDGAFIRYNAGGGKASEPGTLNYAFKTARERGGSWRQYVDQARFGYVNKVRAAMAEHSVMLDGPRPGELEELRESLMPGGVSAAVQRANMMLPIPSNLQPTLGPGTIFNAPRDGHLHQGVDLVVPQGTPVLATADGIVCERTTEARHGKTRNLLRTETEWGTNYGNKLTLYHEGRLVTAYAHLHSFAPGMEVGRSVMKGEIIGWVGNTGNARNTGAHLHFEVGRAPSQLVVREPKPGQPGGIFAPWRVIGRAVNPANIPAIGELPRRLSKGGKTKVKASTTLHLH